MSEFKFACPVCGQHITADSKDSGSQIPCPTCFRKIVVPQAPASSDPKFVLSASEANKPRPVAPGAPAQLEPIQKQPETTSVPLALVALLIAACLAGGTLFLLRGKIFRSEPPEIVETEPEPPVEPKITFRHDEMWKLDLTNSTYPEGNVLGRIHGKDFVSSRATLQGGQFTFRSNPSGPVELGLNIYFFVRQPQELSGRVINITTNDPVAPRVVLRWLENQQQITQPFTGGYTMKLQFDKVAGNRLPGRIYLCLPDGSNSYIAGHFNAGIRNPPPPKPPSNQRR